MQRVGPEFEEWAQVFGWDRTECWGRLQPVGMRFDLGLLEEGAVWQVPRAGVGQQVVGRSGFPRLGRKPQQSMETERC